MDQLKRKLNYHYKFFDRSRISPDPLEFLHKYSDPRDIEVTGLISSVFAYGNVRQIISVLNKINEVMDWHPYNYISSFNIRRDGKDFDRIKHRFYTPEDIKALIYILHRVYTEYSSLKELFILYFFEQDENVKNAVSFFSRNLLSIYSHDFKNSTPAPGLSFMFPDPFKGSACKRMNLFLRWMVRRDELDFGLWPEIMPSQLVIPVDTHVARICRQLGLTRMSNVSWKMAEEITLNLKKYDPADPVKYDFAICHIGMRKLDF